MKRTISKVLLIAVTAAVALSSCSKVPDVSKHIPKTASVVVDLNAKEITQKLATNGLTMDKIFSAVQTKDTANDVMNAWKDAENSGIDLKGHFFVSFVFNGQPEEHKSYLSATASLSDADKFEAFLKKSKKNFSLKTGNEFKYAVEEDNKGVVAWNKSTVIYIAAFDPEEGLNKYNPAGTPGLPGVDDGEIAADSAVATPAALTSGDDEITKSLITEVDHLFHLKKDETAGSIEPFAKLLKANADMGVFVNAEAISNSGRFAMIPANVKKLMEGTFYTGIVNFEKGKIVANGSYYMGKEVASIYKKYGKKEIDMSMLKKYPSQNITGFVSYAFDFHMIGEIIKSTGMDGIVNMFLASKSGLAMDDILNAFEGQLTYVASDFGIQKKESKYFPGEFTEEPSAKWIFSLKVGNKDAFTKVMTSPMLKEIFTKEGDHYVLSNPIMAAGMPPLSITEKYITVGSDSVLLQDYLAGKGSIKLPEGIEGKIKGSMMGGYVDLEKIITSIPEEKADDADRPMLVKLKGLMKDMTMVTKPANGDVSESEVILNFKNKDENSLVQLMNFGTEAAKIMEAKKAKNKAMEDSLFAAPVDTATTIIK
ncbi:DUF4836 family protein [Chitinophaga flava]|uniref:DUF4836 domain-containing protein n=1 Tax=Chitinophaga flava TaxID=2259036 RepID=A0A365Y5I2_9BACT|nr:DUF4836 family protein [Chitinophaga flava]RBL93561.1 hypothetical protein DF182_13705 [Chitinophaga flava]